MLATLVLVPAATVVLPVYFIQPFRSQTPWELQASFWMRRLDPGLTAIALVAFAVTALATWKLRRWPGRTGIVLGLVLLVGCTWFSRQNHFEWMFAPLPHPTFSQTEEAGFLGP